MNEMVEDQRGQKVQKKAKQRGVNNMNMLQ